MRSDAIDHGRNFARLLPQLHASCFLSIRCSKVPKGMDRTSVKEVMTVKMRQSVALLVTFVGCDSPIIHCYTKGDGLDFKTTRN